MERNARWRRIIIRLGWDLALVCALAAVLAGLWLAILAWKLASTTFGMLAVVVVLAAPAIAVAVVVARPERPRKEGEPSGSALVEGIHHTNAVLRIVGLGRAHVGVASSYVVVLWICEAAGYVRIREVLVFFTFACAVTAVAYLPWLASRERRLYDARAEYQRRLGEIEAGRVRLSGPKPRRWRSITPDTYEP